LERSALLLGIDFNRRFLELLAREDLSSVLLNFFVGIGEHRTDGGLALTVEPAWPAGENEQRLVAVADDRTPKRRPDERPTLPWEIRQLLKEEVERLVRTRFRRRAEELERRPGGDRVEVPDAPRERDRFLDPGLVRSEYVLEPETGVERPTLDLLDEIAGERQAEPFRDLDATTAFLLVRALEGSSGSLLPLRPANDRVGELLDPGNRLRIEAIGFTVPIRLDETSELVRRDESSSVSARD
jgi:hypothetical protein